MSQYGNDHMGQRIRQRRWMLGVSRAELAEQLGIEPRQLEAIEAGECLVAAGLESRIARVLRIPASYLSEGDADRCFGVGAVTILSEAEASSLVRAYCANLALRGGVPSDLPGLVGEVL